MKKFNLFFLFIVVALFSSCNKDVIEGSQSINFINDGEELLIPSTAMLITEKSAIKSSVAEIAEADDFARLLAASTKDKKVRKF